VRKEGGDGKRGDRERDSYKKVSAKEIPPSNQKPKSHFFR